MQCTIYYMVYTTYYIPHTTYRLLSTQYYVLYAIYYILSQGKGVPGKGVLASFKMRSYLDNSSWYATERKHACLTKLYDL